MGAAPTARTLVEEVRGVLRATLGWYALYAALGALTLPVFGLRTLAAGAGAHPLAAYALQRLADVATGVQCGVALVVIHVWFRAFLLA